MHFAYFHFWLQNNLASRENWDFSDNVDRRNIRFKGFARKFGGYFIKKVDHLWPLKQAICDVHRHRHSILHAALFSVNTTMHVSVSPLAFICFWLSFWCVAKAKTKWHTVHCHLLVWNRCSTICSCGMWTVIFVEWSRVERINRENILIKVTLFNYFSNISFKISPSPFYYILVVLLGFFFFTLSLTDKVRTRWVWSPCADLCVWTARRAKMVFLCFRASFTVGRLSALIGPDGPSPRLSDLSTVTILSSAHRSSWPVLGRTDGANGSLRGK